MCFLFPTTCILSFQLELRRKQFHVLLSTIHELQQTLESKCCSLVIDITGLSFSGSKGITTSGSGIAVQLRLVTSCIGRIFSPVIVQSLRLLWIFFLLQATHCAISWLASGYFVGSQILWNVRMENSNLRFVVFFFLTESIS